jgi:hypothetical protein
MPASLTRGRIPCFRTSSGRNSIDRCCDKQLAWPFFFQLFSGTGICELLYQLHCGDNFAIIHETLTISETLIGLTEDKLRKYTEHVFSFPSSPGGRKRKLEERPQ